MPRPSIDKELALLRKDLRAHGSPERAAFDRRYLKSDLRFYGVTLPRLRAVAATYARERGEMTRADLRALAEAAYATREHDLRSVAIALLARHRKVLEQSDLAWLIDLVRGSNTWAHVDWLAVTVIGDVIVRAKAPARRIERWAKDESFWVRRTALLAQLDGLKREAGDFELFGRVAAALAEEREFFIRKAIGWVLRETSKRRPELTYRFLAANRERVSRLTLQEGARYLPARQRLALGLAGYPAWKRREAMRIRAAAR